MNLGDLIEEKEIYLYSKYPDLVLYFTVLFLLILILINYSLIIKKDIYYENYLIKENNNIYLNIENKYKTYLKNTIIIKNKNYSINKISNNNNYVKININYDFENVSEYRIKIGEESLLTYVFHKIKER